MLTKKTKKINGEVVNYPVKDNTFKTDNLYVANLEYASKKTLSAEPTIETTTHKYIFRKKIEEGKLKYQEVFTGFMVDAKDYNHMIGTYIVNIVPLKEEVPGIADSVSKDALLIILNKINAVEKTKPKTRIREKDSSLS